MAIKKTILLLVMLAAMAGCAQPAPPQTAGASVAPVAGGAPDNDSVQAAGEGGGDEASSSRDEDSPGADESEAGDHACPEGWRQRIEQAANDPAACALPKGICKQIARGKSIPPGIRRNAEACGLDVDALLAGG